MVWKKYRTARTDRFLLIFVRDMGKIGIGDKS